MSCYKIRNTVKISRQELTARVLALTYRKPCGFDTPVTHSQVEMARVVARVIERLHRGELATEPYENMIIVGEESAAIE